MSRVNKVILIGRLGKDPEIRYTPQGAAVCNFSIATSRVWKDKDGNKKEETNWHNIVAFGKLAEICGKYLTKGKQVFIEGRLKTDKYEKEGQMHYSTKVVTETMQMLGDKTQNPPSETIPPSEVDDIPF